MNNNNKQNYNKNAAQLPLITFDDSNDDQTDVDNIDYANQSIIKEFDPLTHVDNEIPWEYHWYDFVTFTRQYGFIEFISGDDVIINDDSDTDDDNEIVQILAPARPSTPIESGESDLDDNDNIDTDSESENEYNIPYDLPMWTPEHPGKTIIYHNQDNNNEIMQNYCRFILMVIIQIFRMILAVSRMQNNNRKAAL